MGALARITQVQVYIIAAVLTAIAVAGLWFGLISPEQQDLASQTARYDAALPDSTPEKKVAAQKALAQANQQVAEANAKWEVYDRQLMPDIDLSKGLIAATREHWNEQILVLGPKLERFVHGDPNVEVLGGTVQLAPPSTDPNAVNQKYFEYGVSNVSVQGTFHNILRNVERWNHFDRLAEVDGLTLSGTSPRLIGTYSVRIFETTRGDVPNGQTIPGAGNAGGFGGGGFNGPPGGGFNGPPGGGFNGPPGGMNGPPGGYPGRGAND
jgi:hypothetical protein